MTSGQITYDLRRLRLHGLIERIPHTFRYRVTDTGMRSAQFLTRIHDRLLRTGLAQITDPRPPAPTALRAADRAYQAAPRRPHPPTPASPPDHHALPALYPDLQTQDLTQKSQTTPPKPSKSAATRPRRRRARTSRSSCCTASLAEV